jgi:ribosomal protein L16 Arg81 hydroxylase
MPSASVLQRIVHPLTVDEFVDGYFQRRPLRLKRPRNKFDFLFRESDFPVNLDRVRHIRAVFPRNRQAQIRPTEIEHMYEAGATICVTGMEQAHPRLRAAAERVRAELAYAGEITFRAYLSPPGSGFDLHFDARVATTLQIAGKKRWWYSKEPAVAFPLYNSGREPAGWPKARPPARSDLVEVVLEPGDVLCLPAGVWHCAKAQGNHMSLALNMAFDHKSGGFLDFLTGMLQNRVVRDAAWRQPLPVHAGRKDRLPHSVAAMLRERIEEVEADLAALRDNEAALARAWRQTMRSR